jgi:peroxiredoxin-like protein
MPEETHNFHIDSVWTGGYDGDGNATAHGRAIEFGRPEELGGRPGRTSPEELLLDAVASCYSITFAVLAERRNLPVARLELSMDGTVVRQLGGTLKFTAIHIKPRIVLTGPDDAQRQTAVDFAHKAEQYCLISNAIRGNVEVSVEPEVTTE